LRINPIIINILNTLNASNAENFITYSLTLPLSPAGRGEG
jgi:hypothetical protein